MCPVLSAWFCLGCFYLSNDFLIVFNFQVQRTIDSETFMQSRSSLFLWFVSEVCYLELKLSFLSLELTDLRPVVSTIFFHQWKCRPSLISILRMSGRCLLCWWKCIEVSEDSLWTVGPYRLFYMPLHDLLNPVSIRLSLCTNNAMSLLFCFVFLCVDSE